VFVSGGSHLFRQPFPSGRAEQITFGPTEQIGVAAMPDGRSLVTAVGINESAVWLHDSKGEHLISPEGNAWAPAFSHDGHLIYYLLHRGPSSHPQELWVTDLVSGKSTSLMEGFAIDQYRVSTDGKQVVFAVDSSTNKSRIWLAACDRSFPPRLLSTVEGRQPFFGPDNDVVFSASDGNKNYLFRMKLDGSGRTKVIDNPITDLQDMSPDRLWAVVMAPVNGTPTTAMLAVPVHGGSAIPLCPTTCNLAKWSPDGSRFYIEPLVSDFEKGSTAIFTVPAGKSLPALPRTGISSVQDYSALKPAQILDLSSFKRAGQYLSPGPTPDTFVYARFAVHQNLFQVPIE
jgi:Tol biopolymer transport system component